MKGRILGMWGGKGDGQECPPSQSDGDKHRGAIALTSDTWVMGIIKAPVSEGYICR